jgi:hypothetical protein
MTDWEQNVRRVLEDVLEERRLQFAWYGTNYNLPDGVGPEVRWLQGCGLNLDLRTATEIEAGFRYQYDYSSPRTWMQLIREEIAEAFKEDDITKLRTELLQVAALCVSWSEKLDAVGLTL